MRESFSKKLILLSLHSNPSGYAEEPALNLSSVFPKKIFFFVSLVPFVVGSLLLFLPEKFLLLFLCASVVNLLSLER
jgi:hypothetical protein